MSESTHNRALLLPPQEQKLRLDKVRQAMSRAGIESALVSSAANIYYLTGGVFNGWVYLPADGEDPVYIVKRPVHLSGDRTLTVRKPESISAELSRIGIQPPLCPALELSSCSYSAVKRIEKALGFEVKADMDPVMAEARSTKTPYELSRIHISAVKQEHVYRKIPSLYQPGMNDTELQIEIERLSRQEGCLGQFRIAGSDMELFMGNILVGDNADAPSPYDFAMGGAGADPSLPVGANGTEIRRGNTVMVDINGNYSGYMTDMTRCFKLGRIAPLAEKAHSLSIEICRALAEAGKAGTEARALYDMAEYMAREAGLADYFMGHRQHAGFVGHGLGIEINELPVIAPRSKSLLMPGNVIALEPKFVIPGTGAVGIENTYLVTEDGGMECMTHAPEEIIDLE